MATAWLIGAGFSWEFGMPLVGELTSEIRRLLTPEAMRKQNASAPPGHGYPSALIEEYVTVLERSDLHYEQLIGWLQTQSLSLPRTSDRAHLQKLAGALQDIVCRVLLANHKKHARVYPLVLPWFGGLAGHLPEQGPLWIFSLNHDVYVEMIGADLGIDVRCGYTGSSTTLLASDGKERVFDRLTREQIAAGHLDFGPPTRRGVNLVKLHGSLDVFGYDDDLKTFLRVRPASLSGAGWLAAIESAEMDMHALHEGQPYKVINEICTRDATGEIQFLHRTPVAGMLKFDRQLTYNAPVELLHYFARKLDDFDTLVVIGYGWGDAHINGPVETWLARRPEARVVVVNPGGLPPAMSPISTRCAVIKLSAAEYLSRQRWATFSRVDCLKRQFWLKARNNPEFGARFVNAMGEVRADAIAMIAGLVEAERQGEPRDAVLAKLPSIEAMLEILLARMGRDR